MTREITVSADRKYSVFIDTKWVLSLQALSSDRQKVGVVVSSEMKDRLSDLGRSTEKLHIFECGDRNP
jgi:hypothetical protein